MATDRFRLSPIRSLAKTAPWFLALAAAFACGSGTSDTPTSASGDASNLSRDAATEDVTTDAGSTLPVDASDAVVVRDSAPATDATTDASVADAAMDGGADADAAPPSLGCVIGNAPASIDVAEASAAATLTIGGATRVIVLGDSGHHGSGALFNPINNTAKSIVIPVDAVASDDLEGATMRGPDFYTLTSSGAVRRYSVSDTGEFTQIGAAYGIAPSPYTCPSLTEKNCAKNFEGLCLRPSGPNHCNGYAASKTDNSLFCVLQGADGKLEIDVNVPPMHFADIAALSLSDCAFGEVGKDHQVRLFITTNKENVTGGPTYMVDDVTGTLIPLPGLPHTANNEAMAILPNSAFILFEDTSNTPSPSVRGVCGPF
jgi:hypothetical protein